MHLFDEERPVIHAHIVIGILLGLSLVPGRSIAEWVWTETAVDVGIAGYYGNVAFEPSSQLVADGNGDVTATWSRWNDGVGVNQSARYSKGSWGSVFDLNATDSSCGDAMLSASAQGDVMALTRRDCLSSNWLLQSTLYRDDSWGSHETITAGGIMGDVQVVVDKTGVFTAVWPLYNGSNWTIQSARYSDGSWSPVIDVSIPSQYGQNILKLEVDKYDRVIMLGTADTVDNNRFIWCARYSDDGWSDAISLDSSFPYLERGEIVVSADSCDDVLAVWTHPTFSFKQIIQSSHYLNGNWTPIVDLTSDTGIYASDIKLTKDSDGVITAAWILGGSSDYGSVQENDIIQSARYRVGSWDGVINLTQPSNDPWQDSLSPQVIADAGGDVTAVWRQIYSSGGSIIQSKRYSNGNWSSVADLSAGDIRQTASNPRIVADGAGNVTAMWAQWNGSNNWVIQSKRGFEAYSMFVYKTFDGSVVSSPGGIDCGLTCYAKFASGKSVTLTASPAAGYTFAGWSGDCSGSDVCTVTMDSDKSIKAIFEILAPPTYTLTVNKTGQGKITSNPQGIDCGSVCSGEVSQGTSVSLNAVPAAGYAFDGWSGACTGTGSCVLTMDAAKKVSASFTSIPVGPQSVLNVVIAKGQGVVSSYPAGIACGTRCSASFTKGSKIRLYANPAPGYKFNRAPRKTEVM